MNTYIITAHIEFPTKAGAVLDSGTLRMEVPAESEGEARQKARRFIDKGIKIVIDSSEPKPASASTTGNKGFDAILDDFKNVFKDWPK